MPQDRNFDRCRLFLQVPVHLPCRINSPPKDAEIPERSVFNQRSTICLMTDKGPPFNGEEFKCFAREFDFKHQTSSPHFHQSNRFIEAMVKKVKTTHKKMDGAPNSQARALLQLRDTPIAKDLPSPAEILHGWPA